MFVLYIAVPPITKLNPMHSIRHFQFLFALLCVFIASSSITKGDEPLEVGKLTDFIRLSQKEGKRQPESLDTAVVKFVDEKKGIEVDLISAIHIGDKEYYEELNEIFKKYDAMLYELVAEEGTVLDKEKLENKEKSLLSGFQAGMGEALDLDFQLVHVDYTAKNFVHADLSPEKFAERVAERGDMVQMLFRAFMLGMKKGKEGQNEELRLQGRLFGTILTRNPTLALKRLFAKEMIRQMDDSAWVIGGDEGSAIITDRNAAALKVLKKEIRNGKKKFAIFYGAAHLSEFAQSLEKDFKMKVTDISWVVAWDLTSDRSAREKE